MGLFDKMLRNMPGSPKSVAKNLLTNYRSTTSEYPHLEPKQIYKMLLDSRYTNLKTMNEFQINEAVAQSNSLVDLTLFVVAAENPAAASPSFAEATLMDVAGFFKENAPFEFHKFFKKHRSAEKKEDVDRNEVKGKTSDAIWFSKSGEYVGEGIQGMGANATKAVADAIIIGWTRWLGLKINIVEKQSYLSYNLGAMIPDDTGKIEKVQGVLHEDTLWLVGENMSNPADVHDILFHEDLWRILGPPSRKR